MIVYIISNWILTNKIIVLLLIFFLLVHLPNSPIDPADFKAREKKEDLFTKWMDKTFSTRRAKINRLKKQADTILND